MAATVSGATRPEALAREAPAGRPTAWWGMVLFIVTEATLFASLFVAYFYLRFRAAPEWPLGGIETPKLAKPLVMTALLLPSSLPVIWADRAIRKGQIARLRIGLATTIVMGLGFLALFASEYAEKLPKFTPRTNVYGSLFYAITGFHGFHVTVGLLILGWLLVGSLRGHYDERRHLRVQLGAMYWHFVDLIWVAIMLIIYIGPHL
jgi:heme/copper-type cytochrome/quinol oxidase subunit 3